MKLLLIFLFSVLNYAGSAGIKNGTIRGNILDPSSAPIQGAYIVAQFQNDPPFQRSTMSHSDGSYTLNNMPVGPYVLGFSKNGYQAITIGDTSNSSDNAIGKEISAYIESGSTYTVAPVKLKFIGISGQAVVRLKLIDSYTGESVKGSNVVLGATSSSHQVGEFHETSVAIQPTSEGLPDLPLIISTPGYEDLQEEIQAVPSEVNEYTVELTPQLSSIQGRVQLNSFPFPKLLSNLHVSVDNIDVDKVNAKVDNSGFFQVSVPASTDKNKRSFNIRVHLAGFGDIVVPNIISPQAGATTIQEVIKLTPVTTVVRGKVTSSSGLQGQVSAMNQAYIKELGISAPIQNGTFVFHQVPTRIPLTVKAIQVNLNKEVETGEVEFTAIKNGTSQFVIPAIVSTSSSSNQ
ncbi:MAG: carboxypeptidase regulatory-like domain-containing protein [Candidatus Cloacimonetes bacterium]|nr:carboxypeptidase regulatory-like domain-containing protein [Candidatus Cloacimonadota bacterium]